ncbi:MAG: hypothetical protein ABIE68_04590 [bacterium]
MKIALKMFETNGLTELAVQRLHELNPNQTNEEEINFSHHAPPTEQNNSPAK